MFINYQSYERSIGFIMGKYIELYRDMIPASKLINDNANQHYRIHMGILSYHEDHFNEMLNKIITGPGNFNIPDLNTVSQVINFDKEIDLRFELWKLKNIRFDYMNYSKTFKSPLDMLVKSGYLPDDNWKIVSNINYTGGGRDAWKERAFRYENDGLPEELTTEWWVNNALSNHFRGKGKTDGLNDTMIRILIRNKC